VTQASDAPPGGTNDPGQRRRNWIIGGLLAAVIVAAVAVGVGSLATRHRGAPATTGMPTYTVPPNGATGATAPSTDTPSATSAPLGVTFGNDLFGSSTAAIDRAMGEVVSLHMTWIRIDLGWNSLQPKSATSFDWAPMDRILASARRHHLQVLGLLTYTPAWARATGCDTFVCPPRSSAQFARFAAAVARRYERGGLTNYQLWNEPNITEFWSHPDPVAYRNLLDATVKAVHAVQPAARFAFGGLAFTSTQDGNIDAAHFLVQSCAGHSCPVVAVGYDPFTYPQLPSHLADPLNAWQAMIDPKAGTSEVRAAVATAGLKVRIWVTEFGAPTDYPGSSGGRTVSEAEQSRIVVDGLRLARAEPSVVGGFFVDTLQDSATRGTSRNHFGLIRSDGVRKPAFAALAKAVAG
jgi:hypothetical protein